MSNQAMPSNPVPPNIATLNLEALRAEWRRRWGDLPQFRSRDALERALAHRIQAEAFGDLSATLQRRLADLGKKFMADRGYAPQAAKKLRDGSSLIREWKGERHEVAVVPEGFEYQGEKFASLSSAAYRITGTKWNGPVFFGLKRKGEAA